MFAVANDCKHSNSRFFSHVKIHSGALSYQLVGQGLVNNYEKWEVNKLSKWTELTQNG